MDLTVAPPFDQKFTPSHGKVLLGQYLSNLRILGCKSFVLSSDFWVILLHLCVLSFTFLGLPLWISSWLARLHPICVQNPSGTSCVYEAQFAKGLGSCVQVSFESNPCAGIPLSGLDLSFFPGAAPSMDSRFQVPMHTPPQHIPHRADKL